MNIVSFLEILDDINGEISQAGNWNAYTRLLLLPQKQQIAKICYKNYDVWKRNITNLKLISNQLKSEDFPELVLPNELVEHNGNIVGYIMPYVEGITLGKILQSKGSNTHCILSVFDQLASVINRLPANIHIGDLHSQNVIVSNNGNAHVIDVDGFSADNGFTMTCPLCFNNIISNQLPQNKYFNDDKSVKIGINTDIYCLIEIFFTWMFDGINPLHFSESKWKLFIEYLRVKGIQKQVLNMIERLRSEEGNYLIESPFASFGNQLSNISYDDYLSIMGIQSEEKIYAKYINRIIEESRRKNG